MPYSYLEDNAITDVVFRATGKTLEEVFAAAADATLNVMVEDLAAIRDRERIPVHLENEALDLLLYEFLSEFVYFKDARGFLLRSGTIGVGREDFRYTVVGELYGEPLDPQRHPLAADVKAVTLNRFALRQTDAGWEATVVLDI